MSKMIPAPSSPLANEGGKEDAVLFDGTKGKEERKFFAYAKTR